ncbi:MAG: DUF2799 domain-containing protein [Gammaproteobacteria bacterium]|nr:DUF2799 domain-containing protein [Gammaproteobacteria bacterium]
MRSCFGISLITFLLAGCSGGATVSESQCVAGDWQTLGYRDGVRGLRSSQLLAHQDACVKHGIVPDRHGYKLGWEEGIREYCEPYNGFSVGEHGNGHNNVCPSDLRAEFLTAYQEGRSLYLARMEVANLERAITRKVNRLEQIKAEIISTATAQLNPVLTTVERIELLARTERLNTERVRIREEIPALEQDLAIKARHLDALNGSLAAVTN